MVWWMKILITSVSGDAKEFLEKLGVLAVPSDYPNYYFYEIDSLADLFSLTDILGEELILNKKIDCPEHPRENYFVVQIYNDYRE
jgi:hypothetical protein